MTQFWIGAAVILIGLVLAGIGLVLVRYFREIRAARQRLANLGSQVIETDCGLIEYARVGAGYPVLVVHGAIGGFDQGLYVAGSLRLSQCEMISVSRFGHLRSPVPENADLNLQADAFAGLLDALKIERAAVFAISAGSTAAIRFAARHPERVSALILFGPDAPGKFGIVLPPRFVFDVLFRSNFLYWLLITYFRKSMQQMMGLVPGGFVPTAEHVARINHILMGDLPIDGRIDGLIFETYDTAAEYSESILDSSPYPLANVKTPVFIVNALDDPITTAENVQALAEKFPNRRQYLVPDGGHLFFNHDAEVRSEIVKFLVDTIAELRNTAPAKRARWRSSRVLRNFPIKKEKVIDGQ